MRKAIGILVLALVWIGLPAVAAGAGPLPGLECGQTITTSVRLRHDLICPQGFNVVAPYGGTGPLQAITVDLGGHALGLTSPSGTVTCSYFGFYRGDGYACPISAGSGVSLTIAHGTVAGSVGSTDGVAQLSRVHVEGAAILGGYGGPSDPNEVQDSRIDGVVYDFAAYARIQHNVISGGVETNDDFIGQQVTITNNRIERSPADGITIIQGFFSPDVSGVIADNIITRSTGSGISAAGADLNGLVIEGNWLVSNGGDGVELGPTAPTTASATITGNVAIANAGHGFNINSTAYEPGTPGVLAPPAWQPHFVDGGHNVALLNRTSPQCIGLTCQP